MQFEIRKLHGVFRTEGVCLFCDRNPRYSIRILQQDDETERIRIITVCEKHVGRYLRMLFRLFKIEEEMKYNKQKIVEEINSRIIGKSYQIHPREKMDYDIIGTV